MPRKGNVPPTPCPSEQAYRRHLAHGEEPCDGCRQAHRDHGAAQRPTPIRFLGPGECGTIRGYFWHRKEGEDTCPACRDAIAADRRSRYGKATGTHPGRKLAPCGTTAAYARHLQHAEEPCAECRAAHTEERRKDHEGARIVAAMARAIAS